MTDAEQDTRLSVIREICRKEGHGELVDCTRFEDQGQFVRYICQRGCGIDICHLLRPMTLEELISYADRTGGAVFLRGSIEVQR